MGTYGVNCSQTCQCQNEATCSAVDGSCNCTAGFTGEMCNEREFKDLYTHTHTHTLLLLLLLIHCRFGHVTPEMGEQS